MHETSVFVKAYYRPCVGCDCSGYGVHDGRRWVGGGGGVGVMGRVGLPNTAEPNMAVQWWKHGVCVVCTKQRCFSNKIIVESMRVNPPWLVARQTCRNSELSLGIWEDRSLDDDRSGGRVDGMEWCGEG